MYLYLSISIDKIRKISDPSIIGLELKLLKLKIIPQFSEIHWTTLDDSVTPLRNCTGRWQQPSINRDKKEILSLTGWIVEIKSKNLAFKRV